jgi:hypothetical protein
MQWIHTFFDYLFIKTDFNYMLLKILFFLHVFGNAVQTLDLNNTNSSR